MKAKIPRSYLNLPKHEKEAIDKMVKDEINGILCEEEVVLFILALARIDYAELSAILECYIENSEK